MKNDKPISEEAEQFDRAMDKLLKANPGVVKAAMEQEKKERAEGRKAKLKGKAE